jgi:hypothetical protein
MVMGVDIHFEMVPTPAGPIPTPFPNPFIGVVYDPIGMTIGLAIGAGISAAFGGPITGPVLMTAPSPRPTWAPRPRAWATF